QLRMQLAAEGLPEAGDVGFEIFDRSSFGVGEFAQKVNYRRALQGELTRTITQMSDVQRARVHLVIPERRLFSSDREPASAAVVITPRRGKTLSAAQVQGVVHLVSSSVEGLDPSHVTVVDSRGQVLSQPKEEVQAQLTGSQLELRREMERDLERRVQTMLDQVLGVNKSVVRISADLDFRQVEVTEEQYDPEGQVVRSEQRSQEKVIGEESPGGVPGSRSNVPNEETLGNASGSPSEAKRKSETINYEVNRKVSRIVEPSGTMKRLSVSVLVDGTYDTIVNEETGESTSTYVPRGEEEMKKLVESIKRAVGFSEARGDQIEVATRQFMNQVDEGEEVTPIGMIQDFLMTWGGYIKPVAFLLFGLFLLRTVVKPLVTNIIAPPVLEPEPLPEGLPATVAEIEQKKVKVITPEEQAVTLAMQNPQAAAFVVREWMKGDKQLALDGVKTQKQDQPQFQPQEVKA
ncbi:MAG: flagellar basal-body MS-ring/collar protein FliF, partial [Nitrospirae bacterium]|nr:flagellar basal-body MS-ring/collar protein FliF [Nitrospirota bacterium]